MSHRDGLRTHCYPAAAWWPSPKAFSGSHRHLLMASHHTIVSPPCSKWWVSVTSCGAGHRVANDGVRDKYAVRLAPEQREELQRLIRVGKSSARVTARARILLKSDDGWAAPQVAEALDAALSTVYRVKQRFAEEGLEGVLQDRPQANRPRKLDDRGEAHLIALACSPPPAGHDHWTLRLLAGKVVELGLTPSMSHEGVRQRLKKTPSSRGRRRSGAFPR